MNTLQDTLRVCPAGPELSGEGGQAEISRRPPHSDILRGSLALCDQALVSGTNFLTMVLVARLCRPAEVGIFALAWTIVNYLRTAQERLLDAPYVVFAHREREDQPGLLGGSFLHQAAIGASSALIVALLAVYFLIRGTPPGMSAALAALILTTPAVFLRDHLRAVCSAHFRYWISLTISLCVSVLQLGGIGLLAWWGRLTIPNLNLLMGLACAIPAAAWLVFRPLPYRAPVSYLALWVRSWIYARWLVAARMIGILGYSLIPWLVAYFRDEAMAGQFATCSSLVGLSLMFVVGANNYLQPRTIHAYHHGGMESMCRSVRATAVLFLVVLGAISACYFTWGAWLVERIYGPQFAAAGEVVGYVSLGAVTVSISIAAGNGLAALARPRGYFWGELTYCVVAISAALLLIPRGGLEGAAWAMVLAGAAGSAVTLATLIWLIRVERGDRAARPKVLIVGQTPPPFHGQSIMIQQLVQTPMRDVELLHVRMAFSKSIDDVGRFQLAKIGHLCQVIAKILAAGIWHRPQILYYPPAGPQRIPMYRDLVILICTRWLFPKTVFHMQAGGLSQLYQTLSPWQQWWFRRAYFEPDAVIRLAVETPPDAVTLRARQEFIVPNATTDQRARFADLPRPATLRLVYLGTVCQTKGILVLLDACRTLVAHQIDFQLHVVGPFQPTEFEQTVRRHIQEAGLQDYVQLLGQRTGDDKLIELAGADLFCFPTFYESEAVPCVVVEAMSFALPVISTQWRGIPSLVRHGETGFLAAPRDTEEFAKYLLLLAENPQRRQQMGAAAYASFQARFSMDQHLQQMESVFKQVAV